MATKQCKTCKKELNLSEFYGSKRKNGKIYYESYCKKCCTIRAREYRNNNIEKIREEERNRWRRNHPNSSVRVAKKCTPEEKKEAKREYDRLYRLKRRDYQKERHIKYRQTEAGKEVQARVNHKRRMNMENGIHSLSSDEWKIIRDFQDDRCLMCGEKMNEIYLDAKEVTREHIIPVRSGGNTVYGNIVALCRSCNAKKLQVFEECGVPDYITAFMSVA